MSHASLSTLALAAGLLFATDAAADDRASGASAGDGVRGAIAHASIADPPAPDVPEDWIDVVPQRCAVFASIPDRPDATYAWRLLLSLAACVQDASIAVASEPGELVEIVEDMSARLALPMLVYLDALEHADAPIQLRAAFQIGMAYVALSTRARSAIAAPPDLATNAAAASRYRELHTRLEPLLLPARRAAWISFRAIDEAAAVDAELAGTEVERNMVCIARQMLPALQDAAPENRTMLARAAACTGAPVTAAR